MLKKQEICFGRKPVLEALESGRNLDRIFLMKGAKGSAVGELEKLARAAGVPVNKVPREKLNRLTNLNHQGVVALLAPVKYYKVEDIVDQCYAEGRDPLLLMLDGVTDIGNFGAICRTALGLGVDSVIISHYRSAAVNAQAIKASAGAIHHLRISRHKELTDVVDYLKRSGIRIVAMDGSGTNCFHEMDLDGPLAIVMGAEDVGVRKEILDDADDIARLPIDERLESYNVSAAAAMALYEVRRPRS